MFEWKRVPHAAPLMLGVRLLRDGGKLSMQTPRHHSRVELALAVGIALVCLISPASAAGGRGGLTAKPVIPTRPRLQRANPKGWFRMLIPVGSGPMKSHADMDGGFFDGTPIEIDIAYYAYANIPNFLINGATGRPYPESLRPERGAQAVRIGGRRAWVKYSGNNRGRKFRCYVEFFHLPVSIGDGRLLPGTISFDLSTNDRRDLSAIRRIVQSIRFIP